MKKVTIDEKNINDYLEMIPVEYREKVLCENTVCLGMEFAEMPAGAVLLSCEDSNKTWKLLSIYVIPEARRLGIGSSLILEAVKELFYKKQEKISFKFLASEDRITLLPFLGVMGCEIEVTNTPVGVVTIKRAEKKINEVFGAAEDMGQTIGELSNADKNIIVKLLDRTAQSYSKEYLSGDPDSFVIMRDNLVKAVLMFSKEDETTLNLDYAFSSEPKELAMLLKYAVKNLGKDYPADTMIEMLLMSDSSRGLYERLFGEPDYYMKVVEGNMKIRNLD